MRQGVERVDVLGRALRLLAAVVEDGGASTMTSLAARVGVPTSTAHRFADTLTDARYLVPAGRGRFLSGPALHALASAPGPLDGLVALARPVLARLGRRLGSVVHLGILQDDMVTYLLKVGPQAGAFFTREGMQLEAYCSGIGKILLAQMSPDALDGYLDSGPFIALTPHTLTDPRDIRSELEQVARDGHARDSFEVAADLNCLAAPIAWPDGVIRAAISVSRISSTGMWSIPDRWLDQIRAASDEISTALENRFREGASPDERDGLRPADRAQGRPQWVGR